MLRIVLTEARGLPGRYCCGRSCIIFLTRLLRDDLTQGSLNNDSYGLAFGQTGNMQFAEALIAIGRLRMPS